MTPHDLFGRNPRPPEPGVSLVLICAWWGWVLSASLLAAFPGWAGMPWLIWMAGCAAVLVVLVQRRETPHWPSRRHFAIPALVTGIAAWRIIQEVVSPDEPALPPIL